MTTYNSEQYLSDKLLIPVSGNSTVDPINSVFLTFPNSDIASLINMEVKKRFAVFADEHNALINTTADKMLDIEDIRGDVDVLKKQQQDLFQIELQKNKNLSILLSFGALSPEWNGANCLPFTFPVLQKAAAFINHKNLRFQPDVFPTGRNSVQFEYEKRNGDYLEIELFENKCSLFIIENGVEKEFENYFIDSAVELINEFQSRD